MNIAFISYEYPPDTEGGGIATYIYQAARMMCSRGHHVEVFAGSLTRTVSTECEGFPVHRFFCPEPLDFAAVVVEGFLKRHKSVSFDAIEGPDYKADARGIILALPNIPLVLKLHTSTYQAAQAGGDLPTVALRIRKMAAMARRGRKPIYYNSWCDTINELEKDHAKTADEFAAPSIAIGEKTKRLWKLDARLFSHVPLPYTPTDDFLSISPHTNTQTVTFIGRLEKLKGVTTFAQSIALVLKEYPNAVFRFVGRPVSHEIESELQSIVAPFKNSVEFTGKVSPAAIPGILAQTDICVFPSHWESFGLVCIESLAAARGVVGSSAGGMFEILDGGRVGKVIPPRSPRRIANAVLALLRNPEERIRLGVAGRQRIVDFYNPDRIGALQEASYCRAIERRKRLGPRR